MSHGYIYRFITSGNIYVCMYVSVYIHVKRIHICIHPCEYIHGACIYVDSSAQDTCVYVHICICIIYKERDRERETERERQRERERNMLSFHFDVYLYMHVHIHTYPACIYRFTSWRYVCICTCIYKYTSKWKESLFRSLSLDTCVHIHPERESVYIYIQRERVCTYALVSSYTSTHPSEKKAYNIFRSLSLHFDVYLYMKWKESIFRSLSLCLSLSVSLFIYDTHTYMHICRNTPMFVWERTKGGYGRIYSFFFWFFF